MNEQRKENIKAELTDAARTAVENAAKNAVENKKKNAKKKIKRKVRKIIFRICFGLFLLFLGFMLGVHRKVILAYLKGEPLPKAPDWHFWLREKNP